MRPHSEAELAEVVRAAKDPLRIRGGGTRPLGGNIAGAVLETSALTGITLYEPGALTLVARAGTPLAEVEAALAAEGQRLAFEPGDWRGLFGEAGQSTIGGVVAANSSGPRRVQAGACRDSLIGLRFVDGTGAVVKNGGRVMKNVTGYDLVKLMAGSWGTLGVLTEVSFKVLPAPGATATLILPVDDLNVVVQALSAAMGSPFDVSGAGFMPGTGAMVRIEGLSASVDYRAERLVRLLERFAPVTVERDVTRGPALWRALATAGPFHAQQGDVWRISVQPSAAPGVAAALGAPTLLDWGGGLVWALMPEGVDARARMGKAQGHATLVRAGEATRKRIGTFQPVPPALAAISAGLRARFDPKGLLNPGLMG